MAYWKDNADSYICSVCGYECNNPNKLPKGYAECPKCRSKMEIMTNADRIRAMSDEELAEFLDDTQRKECESLHILNDDGTMKFESLKTGWLIWLQQPAEED